MVIVGDDYKERVRAKLGVASAELTDDEIEYSMYGDLAEAYIKKRVPSYSTITDDTEQLYLQEAVINYVCYLIAPTMGRRVNSEVATLDIKWKKEKVNWEQLAQKFLSDAEDCLLNITSVTVTPLTSTPIVNIIRQTRYPIGDSPTE